MEKRDACDGLVFASERRRSDDEVAHLIHRIRRLVAEQRQLERRPELKRREANRRETDRLQDRLASAVKRGLGI
jgi:hypothetical protein